MSAETLSVGTFSDLEQLLSPFWYGPEVEIPPSPPGTMTVPSGLQVQSRLAEDCQWGYTFNGPVIRCFPVSHPNYLLGRAHVPVSISTAGYHFSQGFIKCAVELSIINEKVEKGLRRLLLGLDCGAGGGYLVIFDTVKGHPLRWIRTTSAVESVVIISHFEDKSLPDPLFNETMKVMEGIAGVGLAGGEFILVDLGLDDLRDELRRSKINFMQPSEQMNSFRLVKVEPDEDSIGFKRGEFLKEKELMFVDFHNQRFPPEEDLEDPDVFYYCDASGELLRTMKKMDVHITAMAYAPAIGSIIIGFNFGSFQIWRVESLQLEFSSPFEREQLPVKCFEFQTPLDDPTNHCYLWVLSGSTTAELTPAKLDLFTLAYESATTVDTKCIYTDLRCSVRKLGFYLEDSYLEEEGLGNEGLGTSYSRTHELQLRHLVRPLRMWTSVGKENLLFVAWESRRDGVSYLGIFDLNQWYSCEANKPVPVRLPEGLCPFWAAFKFGGPGIYSELFDVRIIKGTFTRWYNCHHQVDVHLFPASITFQAMCLSARGSYMFEQFGIQEKAIRLIQKEGSTLMAKPAGLREICDLVGLVPQFITAFPQDFPKEKEDQFSIFTGILECTRPAVIVQMANSWCDGSYEKLGLSLNLILEWIRTFVYVVRTIADPHWGVMLSLSSGDLPPETYRFLHYSNFIWNQHKCLLWTLLRGIPDADEEYYDLQFAVEKLVQYSASLVMLQRAKIVPVSSSGGDFTEAMQVYYTQRRESVQTALNSCEFLHPDERGGHPLLIDYLFENLDEEFVREEWKLNRGEPFYPPKHPGHILNFFLGSWIHIPPKFISRIIFYYMLDLIQHKTHRNDLKGDFQSIISLSQDEQKRVEILWMIDHGEFDEGVSRLSRMMIDDEKEGYPWAAALVVLAAQGQERKVLKILQNNSYPPKISRFAFNLACTLEPNSVELLRGTIVAFWHDQPTFFKLLDIADERGLLDSLILSEIYRSSKYVQTGVATYLEFAPKTVQNQIRLLRLFISARNLEEAISLYKIMFREWRDRRLLREVDRVAFAEAEVGLKKLMILTQDRFGVMPAKKPKPTQPTFVAEPSVSPAGSKNCSPAATELKLVPPQIRRLMKDGMEMRAGQTPLSPLKRFAGRVHRVQSELTQTPPGSSLSFTSTPNSGGGRGQLESPNELIKGNMVDLHQLRRTPKVTPDREGRQGSTSSTTPLSTPAGSGDSRKSPRSSMKKKDKGLRSSLLRTRFLDLSGVSPIEILANEDPNRGQSFRGIVCSESSPGSGDGDSPASSGASGSTEPFSLEGESEGSPLSALNKGFQLASDEEGSLVSSAQLEEIPPTETVPVFAFPGNPSVLDSVSGSGSTVESDNITTATGLDADGSSLSSEFKEIQETVSVLVHNADEYARLVIDVGHSVIQDSPPRRDPTSMAMDSIDDSSLSNVFQETTGAETVVEVDVNASSEFEEIPETGPVFIQHPQQPLFLTEEPTTNEENDLTGSADSSVRENKTVFVDVVNESCISSEFEEIPETGPIQLPTPNEKDPFITGVVINDSTAGGPETDTVLGETAMEIEEEEEMNEETKEGTIESEQTEVEEESSLSALKNVGFLDEGFLGKETETEEEESLNSTAAYQSPPMPHLTLAPGSTNTPSPTNSQQSESMIGEEEDFSSRYLTRSRARHLSDATYLAEHEKSFLGLSTACHDGSNDSLSISETPRRRRGNLAVEDEYKEMPTLFPVETAVRAQSEPRGNEKVIRTRRQSMSDPRGSAESPSTAPAGRLTRSGSLSKTTSGSVPSPSLVGKRRGRKRSGETEELFLDTSTESLNSSTVADKSISKGRGRKKTAELQGDQHLDTSSGTPNSTQLIKTPTATSKGRGRKKTAESSEEPPRGTSPEPVSSSLQNKTADAPGVSKPSGKGRGRKKTAEAQQEVLDTSTESLHSSQLNKTLDTSSSGVVARPRRKSRQSFSSDSASTENVPSTRSKSEEPPTRPPPRPKRRRSNSEARDLETSTPSFNQSFSISETEEDEEEWSETSLSDTSFTEGRRRVFDYAPRLSTVLEVTEISSGGSTPISTPMTRSRRRSLSLPLHASMSSIHEEEQEPTGAGTPDAGSAGMMTRKRTRHASTTITPIEEDEESPRPEPRRLRLDSDVREEAGGEESDTPSNASTSSAGTRKKKARTTPRKRL